LRTVTGRTVPQLRRLFAKNFAHSALALFTVTAVLLATLLGGQRYFYCRPMDRIMAHTHCACAQTASDEEGQSRIGVLNDCFETRFVHRLLSFTIGADLAIPAPPLTAVLPAAHLAPPPSNLIFTDAEHPIRAGPFSPTALRAQLMVFLT
jgi:hypothetical protein